MSESSGQGDILIAWDSARAMKSLARKCFHPLKNSASPDAAAKLASESSGLMVAGATNLSLATELYFKTLLMIAGRRVPHSHVLLNLFHELPAKTQEGIELRFSQGWAAWKLSRPGDAAATIVYIWNPPPSRPSEPPADDPPAAPTDVTTMLRQLGDPYSTWRYLYERRKHRSGTFTVISFEFDRLDLLCSVLDSAIEFAVARMHGNTAS